jgi:hypothetical protein
MSGSCSRFMSVYGLNPNVTFMFLVGLFLYNMKVSIVHRSMLEADYAPSSDTYRTTQLAYGGGESDGLLTSWKVEQKKPGEEEAGA